MRQKKFLTIIEEAQNSTSLITHNQGSKASPCSHTDFTDHRWLTAAAWPQSPPGLSGSCRGNTGSSKGRHSEAQRVASRSPWTWGAPRWPACQQTPWKRGQAVWNIGPEGWKEHHRGLGGATSVDLRGRWLMQNNPGWSASPWWLLILCWWSEREGRNTVATTTEIQQIVPLKCISISCPTVH